MSDKVYPGWIETLEDEELNFIKKFILSSGSLKEVAALYEVTYPTVRLRLDRLIQKIEVNDKEVREPYIALIKKTALAEVADQGPEVIIESDNGKDFKTVISRVVKQDDGSYLVNLLNVGHDTAKIKLYLKSGKSLDIQIARKLCSLIYSDLIIVNNILAALLIFLFCLSLLIEAL